jgi:hypothetical protein
MLQDFSIREGGRPAIGGEDSGVQVVVKLFQHRRQPFVVDVPLFFRQCFAKAQLPQNIIHVVQPQIRVTSLAARAGCLGIFVGNRVRVRRYPVRGEQGVQSGRSPQGQHRAFP